MLLILFGQAGAGKTYIGQVLKRISGFPFHDGDTDLTPEMKEALQNQTKITDGMRNAFIEQLLNTVEEKLKKNENLIVAQTFVKERFRKQALERFPNSIFILVKAYPRIREKRISDRSTMKLDANYRRRMDRRFQKPLIKYLVLENNQNGKDHILKQLKKLNLFE